MDFGCHVEALESKLMSETATVCGEDETASAGSYRKKERER